VNFNLVVLELKRIFKKIIDISQTSDFSQTSDVFLQGKHCLFYTHFTEQGVSQTSDVWQTSDVYPR
jgi:hypothetical protein